jgi:hypothetical protein
MDIDAARERNQEKAERGPVRKARDAAPIADAFHAFHARDDLSFGIPALRVAAR